MNQEDKHKKLTIKPPVGSEIITEPKGERISILPPKDAVILTETELLEKKREKKSLYYLL